MGQTIRRRATQSKPAASPGIIPSGHLTVSMDGESATGPSGRDHTPDGAEPEDRFSITRDLVGMKPGLLQGERLRIRDSAA